MGRESSHHHRRRFLCFFIKVLDLVHAHALIAKNIEEGNFYFISLLGRVPVRAVLSIEEGIIFIFLNRDEI